MLADWGVKMKTGENLYVPVIIPGSAPVYC